MPPVTRLAARRVRREFEIVLACATVDTDCGASGVIASRSRMAEEKALSCQLSNFTRRIFPGSEFLSGPVPA